MKKPAVPALRPIVSRCSLGRDCGLPAAGGARGSGGATGGGAEEAPPPLSSSSPSPPRARPPGSAFRGAALSRAEQQVGPRGGTGRSRSAGPRG